MQNRFETNQSYLATPSRSKINWKVWWHQLRPHTLTASFVPVAIGTALALQNGQFHLLLFLAMMFASILIQAATNMFNEYYDYVRGNDTADSIGIGGGIVREGIKAKTIMRVALVFYAISVLLGVYICLQTSWWIAVIGSICMAVGYFYTGGPYPIAYTPFGELFAGFFMGCMIVLISFFIQTKTITVTSILVSLPILILVGAILMANNIRDFDGDKKFGRHTLAILLGRDRAVMFLAGMFIISYIWIICLIALHIISPWLLLVFVSAPKAIQATRGFKGKTLPIQMLPAMKATAQTNTIFGFFMAVGLVLTHWF